MKTNKTNSILLTAILSSLWLTSLLAFADLTVVSDENNVVSSQLEGRWELNSDLSAHLGSQLPENVIEFKSDPGILTTIPEKFSKFFGGRTIYMAGIMTRKGVKHPFVLLNLKGNPHIVYFRERGGNPMGDAESFNVMLAVAKDEKNHLLFIGGDFNNQPFSAYNRSAKE